MKKESMNHINDSRQILSFFGGWGWGVDCGVGEDIKKAYSNSTRQAADRSHDDDTACMQNNSASSCYVNINIVVSVSPSATCAQWRISKAGLECLVASMHACWTTPQAACLVEVKQQHQADMYARCVLSRFRSSSSSNVTEQEDEEFLLHGTSLRGFCTLSVKISPL